MIFSIIEKLKKSDIEVDASILWNKGNFIKRREIRNWSLERGIKLRENFIHFDKIDSSECVEQHNISDYDLEKLIMENYMFESEDSLNNKICGGKYCNLAISTNGDIYPCTYIRTPISNVLSENIIKDYNMCTDTTYYRECMEFIEIRRSLDKFLTFLYIAPINLSSVCL
ncbi:hypothetical protein [Proteiniborus sp. MB09-C3]|uniref:hypothetical protein n=1 Tax=Proteiniborus sp. MB09-C3 TaxID=3050072 RepID=UPI002554EBD9|nr:hypothetical protein [Proteiniborus sp. MB09-C3]WIV12904.1 hypothetical protein QO263_04100 [Proteiniborus sp. MB09-C3]